MMNEPFDEFQFVGLVGFRERGAYDSLESYRKFDFVTYEGSTWLARLDDPDKRPGTDTEQWACMALGYPIEELLVTGVKGDAEPEYRYGNINITKEDIGLGNVDNISLADGSVTSISYNGQEQQFRGDVDLPIVNGIIYNGKPVETGVVRVNSISGIAINGTSVQTGVIITDIVTGLTINGERHIGETELNVVEGLKINGSKQAQTGEIELNIVNSIALNGKPAKSGDLALDVIEGIQINGEDVLVEDGIARISIETHATSLYAICSSSGNDPIKHVDIPEDKHFSQSSVLSILFQETNTAADIMLQINEEESVPLLIRGKPFSQSMARSFQKGGVYSFIYDGESWHYLDGSNEIHSTHDITMALEDWVPSTNEFDPPYLYTLRLEEIEEDDYIKIRPQTGITPYEDAEIGYVGMYPYKQKDGEVVIGCMFQPVCDFHMTITIEQ